MVIRMVGDVLLFYLGREDRSPECIVRDRFEVVGPVLGANFSADSLTNRPSGPDVNDNTKNSDHTHHRRIT